MPHTIPMSVLTGAMQALNAALPVLDKHAHDQWFEAQTAMHRIKAYIDSMQPVVVEAPKPEPTPVPAFLREAA